LLHAKTAKATAGIERRRFKDCGDNDSQRCG
jgi:hypothetical protein